MLILTRKISEKIIIGDDISLSILDVKGNQVRLGIEAPKEVSVHREEIYNKIEQEVALTRIIYKKRPKRVEHKNEQNKHQQQWH